MTILSVIGARPQFVKAAVVSRALAEHGGVEEVVVHTGQHYDPAMSRVFFDELGIPTPRYNLEVGSGSHGVQTARILERLEAVVRAESPDMLLIYGDTNSTLAGALVGAKLHVPVAHVEAGMRSFNRSMPEEVNRVVADHLADFHFCATQTAVENLHREGVREGVHWVGDVMLDAVRLFSARAKGRADPILGRLAGPYAVVTCHRAENTDDAGRLRSIVTGIDELAREIPVFFPVHPRTLKALAEANVAFASGVRQLAPLPYTQMLDLQARAAVLLTDSGGMQKEALFLGVPCVTLRDETEWVETLAGGWNRVVGASADRLLAAARTALTARPNRAPDLEPFGGGSAAVRIVERLAGGPK